MSKGSDLLVGALENEGGPIVSTQRYFPGQARNASDSSVRPDLLLKGLATRPVRRASFNFVFATCGVHRRGRSNPAGGAYARVANATN